ncbi:MAG: carbohydrate-binding domain-containing protein [Clostridiales bacterium]|nr:carbohydrate-binding domain-containing protein [Clostridiales bacterium]
MKIANMKNILKTAAIAMVLTVALTGCTLASGGTEAVSETTDDKVSEVVVSGNSGQASSDVEELSITDKDLNTEYDESEAEVIDLDSTTGPVRITEEGTYIVTGRTSDGMLIVEVDEEEDVQIVLRDASITSASSAAIYVISADEVYITLEGENTLANGGTFTAIDENDIDSVIYSKDDLTINGEGSLKITSPAGHGIVCKDDMVIASGTYDITASEDGINTNESLAIADCSMTIEAGDDAVHTDGMLQIDGGSFDITAAEGLEGTYIVINDGSITISASDDGINAAQKSDSYTPTVEINSGNITITMGQGDTDGIDSNGNIFINGGEISITGQSACDYDGTAELNGGTLTVNGQQVTTIPNQMMGGGMMGGGQAMPQMNGDANFDPASSGERPEMPDGGMPQGMGPGGRGQRPDIQQAQQ